MHYVEDNDDETISIFTEREGLVIKSKENITVLDFLELYLSEEIIIHVVNETN